MMNRRNAVPATEARTNGKGSSMLVGRNGEINASSQLDLLRQLQSLAAKIESGEVMSLAEQNRKKDGKSVAQRREELTAAYYSEPGSREWAALGATISAELQEVNDREGFMRRFLFKAELQQGAIPRHRVRQRNMTAILASVAAQNMPIFIRENYILPPEFYIQENIMMEEREIQQGSPDLLNEKYYEGLEAIMVGEDKRFISLCNDAVGIENPLTYLPGGLTPQLLAEIRTNILSWGLSVPSMLIASDIWNYLIANDKFVSFWSLPAQHEIAMTGEISTVLGMKIVTDAFRHPTLRVLDSGELFCFSDPEMLGAFTDRGPVNSNEIDHAKVGTGVPARGWNFYELMSMALHNPRAIAKGKVG